jgi:hypothetical protein
MARALSGSQSIACFAKSPRTGPGLPFPQIIGLSISPTDSPMELIPSSCALKAWMS